MHLSVIRPYSASRGAGVEGTEEVQWRLLQRGETWSELTLSFFLLWHLPNVIFKKLYLFAFCFAGSLLLLGLFSSCDGGCSVVAVCSLLTAVPSLVAAHGLQARGRR